MIESAQHSPVTDTKQVRDRFRVRFAKTGLLRWIGHQDLQRLWERMLRRHDLPLAQTTGFHPRSRIMFASALALGVEGLDEVVEFEICEKISPAELREILVRDQQPGLSIGEVTLMATNGGHGDGSTPSPGLNKAKHHSSSYEVEIPESYDLARVDAAIAYAKSQETLSIERKGKTVTICTGQVFPAMERRDRSMCIEQMEIDGPSLKVTDLLMVIGLDDLVSSGAIVRRTRLYLTDQLNPLSVAESPTPTN